MRRLCPRCGRQGLEYNPKTRVLWCLYLDCDYREVGIERGEAAERLNDRDIGYLLGVPYQQNHGDF